MKHGMPEVKRLEETGGRLGPFDSLALAGERFPDGPAQLRERLWDLPELRDGARPAVIRLLPPEPAELEGLDDYERRLWERQGYSLAVTETEILVRCAAPAGFQYAVSTLKQLLERAEDGWYLGGCRILDWPAVEHRSLSVTFAWYAGYGRFGFDMQLWGLERWKQFLRICADYKINQLNLCLYGYWPFEMPRYPETVCRGLPMKVWNAESGDWVEIAYMHPNVAREFLPELIAYGHGLGIAFYAYIGLNSYSGGYANAHPEKRMKKPEGSGFINDFDSLCLSDPETIDYLKYCMGRVVDQGFDGIDFEESEEAFWYCQCDGCRKTFWKDARTPEEALHHANTYLLGILYEELKRRKPDLVIGIRAWRQPPLVRDEALLRSMVESIPEDVVLFWAPGQYVADEEFDKWIAANGSAPGTPRPWALPPAWAGWCGRSGATACGPRRRASPSTSRRTSASTGARRPGGWPASTAISLSGTASSWPSSPTPTTAGAATGRPTTSSTTPWRSSSARRWPATSTT